MPILSKAKDFTADLHTAALWTTLWDIEFGCAKCKTLLFGRGQVPNLAVEDERGRHVLELVNAFKNRMFFTTRM